MNITLHIYEDNGQCIDVEMPGATTGKYALARCAEALDKDPLEFRGWLVPYNLGETHPNAEAWRARLLDDDIVAPWDGKSVILYELAQI